MEWCHINLTQTDLLALYGPQPSGIVLTCELYFVIEVMLLSSTTGCSRKNYTQNMHHKITSLATHFSSTYSDIHTYKTKNGKFSTMELNILYIAAGKRTTENHLYRQHFQCTSQHKWFTTCMPLKLRHSTNVLLLLLYYACVCSPC